MFMKFYKELVFKIYILSIYMSILYLRIKGSTYSVQ